MAAPDRSQQPSWNHIDTGHSTPFETASNTDFSSNIEDLVRAADWLRVNRQAPALVIGHSLGGAAVLAAAPRMPEARAVATIGAPAEPADLRHLFPDTAAAIEASGDAEVAIGGRTFRLRKAFLDDIASHRLAPLIADLGRPLLVLHSPRDAVVDTDNAAQTFMAAKHPKSFVSLDDADHLLSRVEDADYTAGVVAAWASRYVPAAAPDPAFAADQGEVVVFETGEGRLQQAILAGPHRLIADEPKALGGDDTGPTPYGLLLAALGACTTMTLRLYVERKGLALRRASIRLRHARIHAEDCTDCETRIGKIDDIESEPTLEGDLDDTARERLLEIADRCPVHRTLHAEVRVRTPLVSPTAGGG